jgi:opacity protein-like surface antigen
VINLKRTFGIVIGLMGVALHPAAAADRGFYLTGSLGATTEDVTSAGVNISNGTFIAHIMPDDVAVDDGELAWSVGIGYRIHRYLAAEVEYVDFGTTHIDEHYAIGILGSFPFPTDLDLAFSSNVTGPVLSVLGALPVGERLEFFLRGGALFASRDYSTEGNLTFGQSEKFASTVWIAGAGAAWSFNKRWAIRAEYQQTGTLDKTIMSGETELRRASLSALFRF